MKTVTITLQDKHDELVRILAPYFKEKYGYPYPDDQCRSFTIGCALEVAYDLLDKEIERF